MKGFLHALSAFGGLALAATIVFFVFGQADEQGAAQEGSASGGEPGQAQVAERQSAEECGTVQPGKAGNAAAVKAATDALPVIINEEGLEVRITDAGQERWFARMQAASGICLDEVSVKQKRIDISASYGDDVTRPQVEQYIYGVLHQSFQQPLARELVVVKLRHDGRTRTALVRHHAWATFQQNRARLDLPQSVQGLRTFRQRIGYDANEMRFQGW